MPQKFSRFRSRVLSVSAFLFAAVPPFSSTAVSAFLFAAVLPFFATVSITVCAAVSVAFVTVCPLLALRSSHNRDAADAF